MDGTCAWVAPLRGVLLELPPPLVPADVDADVDAARFVEGAVAVVLRRLSWSLDERPRVRMLAAFLVVLLVVVELDVEVDAADDGGLSLADSGSSSGTPVRPYEDELDSLPLRDLPSLPVSGENMEAEGRG